MSDNNLASDGLPQDDHSCRRYISFWRDCKCDPKVGEVGTSRCKDYPNCTCKDDPEIRPLGDRDKIPGIGYVETDLVTKEIYTKCKKCRGNFKPSQSSSTEMTEKERKEKWKSRDLRR
jgi:hypothetical protein